MPKKKAEDAPSFQVDFRSASALPESIDWRKKGAVTSVKRQVYRSVLAIAFEPGYLLHRSYVKAWG